nr:hypothetical protein CFP56_07373 [Quercus suber]
MDTSLPTGKEYYDFKFEDVFKNLEDVDNNLDWSLQVKTKLADQQLWDIVEGNDKLPKQKMMEKLLRLGPKRMPWL